MTFSSGRVQIDFRIGNVTQLEGIEGPFDLVLDIGCFHNLASQARQVYLHQLLNLLAPGSTFLLYAFLRNVEGAGRGISDSEIDSISRQLKLTARKDSVDTARPASVNAPASTWLTFEKPA